jgi:hypothetical protein
MTDREFEALCRKAYHPSKLTNRELGQLRRSSRVGSNLLYKVVKEQFSRGLLRPPKYSTVANPDACTWDEAFGDDCGYWPEKAKRLSDYNDD